jgi:hypothetical protein
LDVVPFENKAVAQTVIIAHTGQGGGVDAGCLDGTRYGEATITDTENGVDGTRGAVYTADPIV